MRAEAASTAAPGRVVVCPTPIGNLADVSLRVLDALREADVVACEDTRRTRVLLDRHGIRAAELTALHEHNERERAGSLVERAAAGERVVLVTDAGTPVVSDPGWVLVRTAIEAEVAVEVLPGPSAVLVALVASGLPVERWCFAGFLPRREPGLRAVFAATETAVAFESPRRIGASLAVLAAVDPGRPCAVCRELTKVHEEVVRGTAAELAARFAGGTRGEVVLVVGAAAAGGPGSPAATEAVGALRRLVDAGARTRPAAGVVAELTGVPANALYRALTE